MKLKFLAFVMAFMVQSYAISVNVTSLADSGPGSLRAAIAAVNAAGGGPHTITFGVTGTISLLSAGAAHSALNIKAGVDVSIVGPGVAGDLVLDASGAPLRIFNVSKGASLSLSDLTLTGGNPGSGGGGAILNRGNVSVSSSIFTSNSSPTQGGAIYNLGTIADPTSLLVEDSSFSSNTAAAVGGAIANNGGDLLMGGSTLSANTAYRGGAVANIKGDLTLFNTTLSGNTTSSRGGALHTVAGVTYLIDTTIAFNTSGTQGGGIASDVPAVTNLTGTIVAKNTAAVHPLKPDVYGNTFVSGGYNLIGDKGSVGSFTGAGDMAGTLATPIDPLLAPLAANGGLTLTHALLAGSPAIDAGNPGSVSIHDQRGFTRPSGAGFDIGSFEAGALASGLIVTTEADALSPPPPGSLRAVVALAESLGGGTITFASHVHNIVLLEEILISDPGAIIIDGPGVDSLIISGDGGNRLFKIEEDANVNIRGMVLTDGASWIGGAVWNWGDLAVVDCRVESNSAFSRGGGIANDRTGTLFVNRCTIQFNASAMSGGGVCNFDTGVVTVFNSTFTDNFSAYHGGALENIHNTSVMNLTNCTIVGNEGTKAGGGVASRGVLTVKHCTITNNTTNTRGGGISTDETPAIIHIQNTIVAQNSALGHDGTFNHDVDGHTYHSLGHNLIGRIGSATTFGALDMIGTDASPLNPLLGPLADNGGPTLTRRPDVASPVVDAGAASSLLVDQRTFDRPVGAGPDIGAVELQLDELGAE